MNTTHPCYNYFSRDDKIFRHFGEAAVTSMAGCQSRGDEDAITNYLSLSQISNVTLILLNIQPGSAAKLSPAD